MIKIRMDAEIRARRAARLERMREISAAPEARGRELLAFALAARCLPVASARVVLRDAPPIIGVEAVAVYADAMSCNQRSGAQQ